MDEKKIKSRIGCVINKVEENMYMSVGAATHRGKIRENNEDSLYMSGIDVSDKYIKLYYRENYRLNERTVFGVFDGMGGLYGGEIASGSAVCKLAELVARDKNATLKDYIIEINEHICKKMCYIHKTMGSTAVILSVDDEKFEVSNIGDSRCYLLRENNIQKLSEDHTESMMFRKMEEDIGTSLCRINGQTDNILTQYLGIPEQDFIIEPYTISGIIKRGDIFLLCSDGLSSMLCDDEICQELLKDNSVMEKRNILLKRALKKGGKDNITFILLKFY